MDLEKLRLTGIRTSTKELDVHAYRRDLWPRDTLNMFRDNTFPESPCVVAWPETKEQVASALRWADDEGVPVVPYGAGSGVCGGASGRARSLVIDTKRMRQVLHVDTDARTAHVQAGIIGQHLEDHLHRLGWMTAHSPSSIMCSTVGGYVAARSAGQFSSRYGVFSDMLLAARAVTPTGELSTGRWTPPNQPCYQHLLCGSEGTLGVVTDALLRISPSPKRRWFHGYAFANLDHAWDAMRKIMQAGLWPSALRLYDPVDTRIGGRAKAGSQGASFFGQFKRAVQAIPGLQRHLLDLPLALPNLVNRLANGLGDEVLLIVGFDGDDATVRHSIEKLQPFVSNARNLGAAPGQHWFDHRHDVSYKLAPVFINGAFADTCEVAATWDRLPQLYREVRAAIAKHGVVMAHFSHAYPEGCSIYFSFAAKGSIETYDQLWSDALHAAANAGGTATHHHGVGILKARAASREIGAALPMWHRLRRKWDPKNTMNPGRLFVADENIPDGPQPPSSAEPVLAINEPSRLARVRAASSVVEIAAKLGAAGWQLSVPPEEASYARWLPELNSVLADRWREPAFAMQFRFKDGRACVLGRAPRSAAGPDLRWSALQEATLEWVEVPIRPTDDDVHIAEAGVDGNGPC